MCYNTCMKGMKDYEFFVNGNPLTRATDFRVLQNQKPTELKPDFAPSKGLSGSIELDCDESTRKRIAAIVRKDEMMHTLRRIHRI